MTTDLNLNGVALSAAVPSALVLDVRRQLVGLRRHSRLPIPGRAGAWTYTEEPGDRDISVDISVIGDDLELRRTAVRDLAYWVDIGEVSRLIIDDEPDRFHDVILAAADQATERLLHGKATLRFSANPFALAVAISTRALSAPTSPTSSSFAETSEVYAEPVVEITNTVGGTDLTGLTFAVNGYALTWSGVVGAGDILTISSLSDTVTLGANADVDLVGAYDPLDVDMADVSGEFPLIFAGANPWSITYTGADAGVTIALAWRERFR